jgi:hypothetical protein
MTADCYALGLVRLRFLPTMKELPAARQFCLRKGNTLRLRVDWFKHKQAQMRDFRHLESLASFQNLLAVTVAVVLISLVLIWLSRPS